MILTPFFRFFGAVVVARSFSSIVAVAIAVDVVVADVVGRFRWGVYRFTSLTSAGSSRSVDCETGNTIKRMTLSTASRKPETRPAITTTWTMRFSFARSVFSFVRKFFKK